MYGCAPPNSMQRVAGFGDLAWACVRVLLLGAVFVLLRFHEFLNG